MKKILLPVVFLISCMAGNMLYAQEHQTIKRDKFSLKYPAAWKIDTEDEDYDPDALFSIDSPDGENMIMFVLFDASMDAEELLKTQMDAFTAEVLKKPEVITFDTWGKYKGKGKILKGKLLGVYSGFVRIFVFSDDNKTLMVVEQCSDKDYTELKKDYDLIASSFSFH